MSDANVQASPTTTTAPTTATPSPADPSTTAPAPVAPASIITAPAEPAAPAAPAEPAAPVVPEKYTFEPPVVDGKPVEVDPAALGTFEETARAAGLTQAQFEAVAGLGLKVIGEKLSAAMAAAVPEFMRPETQAAWQTEAVAALGAKPGEALAQAAKVLDGFGGGKAVRDVFDQTMAGNHPAIVKWLVEIGKAMGDGGKLMTGGPPTKETNPNDPAAREQRARSFYNQAGGNYPDVGA